MTSEPPRDRTAFQNIGLAGISQGVGEPFYNQPATPIAASVVLRTGTCLPLCPSRCSKRPRLFDDLVGACEQRERDGDAERLGGLEVDDEFDLRGLLDRQVGRLFASENSSGIN